MKRESAWNNENVDNIQFVDQVVWGVQEARGRNYFSTNGKTINNEAWPFHIP
jgi:hypothetical protein